MGAPTPYNRENFLSSFLGQTDHRISKCVLIVILNITKTSVANTYLICELQHQIEIQVRKQYDWSIIMMLLGRVHDSKF